MDAKTVINLGLGKLGTTRVSNLDPPRTPLEVHCAAGWPVWRDTELEARMWRFALGNPTRLVIEDTLDAEARLRYGFKLPNDCLRPLRGKRDTWEQRGDKLYMDGTSYLLDGYIKRVEPAAWPSSFVSVMACRVAVECAFFKTGSTGREENLSFAYERAIQSAGLLNAFVNEPEDKRIDDINDEWISARFNNGGA